MSYEGYSQFMCKNGHSWSVDCYIADEMKECPICFSPAIWENMVDTTNGSFDDEGNQIDGYVELEVESQKICEHCGTILETIYKIPEGKGRKL